jgi:6-phosphogluconolactonase
VYIGSYSTWGDPPGRGLDVGRVDPRTGGLTITGTADKVPDASFFAFSRDRRFLYATNELTPDGSVTAVDVAEPLDPVVLNRQPTRGGGPTHLSVHPSGRFLLTANHTTGSVVVHRLDRDGRIGESTDLVRHDGTEPHAHQVLTDPSGRWVVAVDLGADSVFVYRLHLATGTLDRRDRLHLPPGAGPRHLAFHPGGRFAYILGELRSEITVAAWDVAAGRLTAGQVIPTVADGVTNFPAELVVSRDGRFVHATNRGENTIVTFTTHDGGGRLAYAGSVSCGGDWPRHLTLSPDERWVYVANQRSNAVTWLPRDPGTGRIGEPAGSVAVNNVAVVAVG